MIGVAAVLGQALLVDLPHQGLDLIDSFFINALLGQFTHLGWAHLMLNLAGVALLAWGFSGLCSQGEWLVIQMASLVWTPLYLLVVEPIDWYCGLSGALHCQFVACLLLAFTRGPGNIRLNWPLWIMAVGLLMKLVMEWNIGQVTDELVGGPIAIQAHRGGAIGGLLLGIFIWKFSVARPVRQHV
ncbi:MAG TPA: rhomboid family intramembrane serine protease [Limnobacter sp.]|nr:rhomboid family intramembrane serine protease [Limnobacter sp.]